MNIWNTSDWDAPPSSPDEEPWDAEDVLERARSGAAHGRANDGCVVLMLSRGESGEEYNLHMVSSGLRAMELVSLFELAKHDVLHWKERQ